MCRDSELELASYEIDGIKYISASSQVSGYNTDSNFGVLENTVRPGGFINFGSFVTQRDGMEGSRIVS
ncbi:hypothetical protein ACU8KH_02142 [Lachancea thermotolerans]